MPFSKVFSAKRFLGAAFLCWAAFTPLWAQTSITSNDGGTSTTGNLYEAVTTINGTAGGGNVTLDISGSNSVTLGQALPTLSQSLTFLGTAGTDQTLGIFAQSEAEGKLTSTQTLGLGNGVTLNLFNLATGGSGSSDSFVSVGGTLSVGTTSFLGATAGSGAVTGTTYTGTGVGLSGSLTAQSGSNAAVTTGGWILGPDSAASLSGGFGGGVSVSNSGPGTAVSGSVTAGSGGSAAVSAGSFSSAPGDGFSLSGGLGGSVSIYNASTGGSYSVGTGIGGNATAGNGGAAAAALASAAVSASSLAVSGGQGGSVTVDNNSAGTGGVAVGYVNISSGNGGNATGGNGGAAGATLGPALFSGSSLSVFGGNGGGVLISSANNGIGAGIGNNAVGGNGGVAGVSAGSVTVSGSALTVWGGAGGAITADNLGLYCVDDGAIGGAGGNAGVSLGSAVFSDSSLSVLGGWGGSVTVNDTAGIDVGIATGGNGGTAGVSLGSAAVSASSLAVAGGTGGSITISNDTSSFGVAGGAASGNGGAAGATLGSGSFLDSLLTVTGGAGGMISANNDGGPGVGGMAIEGNATGGIGGAAGVSLGAVTLSGSSFAAVGGVGGGLLVFNSSSLGYGISGSIILGNGGSAGATLGSATITDSPLFSISGGAGGSATVNNSGAIGISNGISGGEVAGNGGAAGLSLGSATASGSLATVSGGVGGSLMINNSAGTGIYNNTTGGNGGAAGVSMGSASLSGSSWTVSGGAGGNIAVTNIGGYSGISGNATAGNGGNAGVFISNLTMDAGSSLIAMGGAAGSVVSSGTSAIVGTITNGTAGSAFVTLGSLNGSGTVSLWGAAATLQVGKGDFTGLLAGDETVVVSGPGTLFLNGVNNYSGPTSIAASAVVYESGTLPGAMSNNGTLAPGNGSAGTLTVGNYTQAAGATLAIGVAPSQSTALSVQGTANLAGALTVTASGNFGVKYSYEILTTANPLTTRFASYGYSVPAYLNYTLNYGANDVELTLTRNNTDFGAWAQNGNEQAVASALNSAVTSASGDLLNKMNALYTQSSGQAGMLEQLGGVVYTALPNLAVETAQFQTGRLIDRLEGHGLASSTPNMAWNPGPYADAAASDADSPLKPVESKGYWLEQTDSFGSLSGNSEVSAFNQASYGLMGGYESTGGDGLVSGFAAGYLHTNLNSQGADGTAGVDNWQGDIYGKYRIEALDLAVVLGYGFNQYQVSRSIGTGIQAAGAFTGNQISANLQLAQHLTVEDLNPEILAGAQYTFVETAAFTERNADSYDLSVPEANTYSLRPYLGLGVEPKVKAGSVELEPVVKVTAAQEMLTQSAQQEITLAGAAQSPFTINGVTPETTVIGAEAGLGLKLDKHLKLYAAYDGYFGGNATLNTVAGGLNIGF